MLVFLDINGYELIVEKGVLYKLIIDIATKQISRSDLVTWLQKNSRKKKN